MFRSNQRDSDHDFSDDESGPSVAKLRRPDPTVTQQQSISDETKKKHNVWADVVIEQELDMVGGVHMEDKSARVDRGSESFVIPTEELKEYQKESHKKEDEEGGGMASKMEVPIVAVSPAVDDPFADAFDLTEVEGFGFDNKGGAPSEMKRTQFYYQGPNRGRGGRGNMRGGGFNQSQSSSSSSGRGDGQRGRGRGGRPSGMTRGNKRQWDGKHILKKIIAPDYSLESLMATEFDEGLSIEELGEQIAKALGEKDPTTVKKIVVALGHEKAFALFEKTRQKEAEGGVMVFDGSRRRAPGGAFIIHFKEDPSVAQDVKDHIFLDAEKQDRQWKRAKRKGRRPATFEDSLKEFSEKIKQRHGGPEEGEVVEEEMKEESEKRETVGEEEMLDYGEDEPIGESVKEERGEEKKMEQEETLKPLPDVVDVLVKPTVPPTIPKITVDQFMGDEWD